MPEVVTWWDRIIGTWAAAAGISLLFTFARHYRARFRYVYLAFLGLWALLWGVQRMRTAPLAPHWLFWLLFALGIATMLADSVRRYRESSARLRRERRERRAERP